jgi:hypothetical protein
LDLSLVTLKTLEVIASASASGAFVTLNTLSVRLAKLVPTKCSFASAARLLAAAFGQMPELMHLHVSFTTDMDLDLWFGNEDYDVGEMYEELHEIVWDVPNIRSLRLDVMKGHDALTTMPDVRAPNLTSLTLQVDDLARVVQMCYSAPHLQVLHLDDFYVDVDSQQPHVARLAQGLRNGYWPHLHSLSHSASEFGVALMDALILHQKGGGGKGASLRHFDCLVVPTVRAVKLRNLLSAWRNLEHVRLKHTFCYEVPPRLPPRRTDFSARPTAGALLARLLARHTHTPTDLMHLRDLETHVADSTLFRQFHFPNLRRIRFAILANGEGSTDVDVVLGCLLRACPNLRELYIADAYYVE